MHLIACSIGFASEVLSVPFECNFKDHPTPSSIKAIWTRLALPVIILAALFSTFIIIWTFLYSRDRRQNSSDTSGYTTQRFVTCLIVISLVTAHFSYINIVRDLLRGIHCIELQGTSPIADHHPYMLYAIEDTSQNVWAEDTTLVCFQGQHQAVGVVCVVGLFITLCWIIAIIIWLPLNKKHITRTKFVSRYWFIYQGYKKEWYTISWESMILLRKAMIAAVLVYSVHLGPSLQATLCVGILIVAHILHSLISPFKTPEDHEYIPEYAGWIFKFLRMPGLGLQWVRINNLVHLNLLESASLASSIVMFYSAIILQDSNSSSLGYTIMSGFTFTINVMFLWYALYRLYAGLHVLLDAKLEVVNTSFMAMHVNSMGIISLYRKLRALQGHMILSQTDSTKTILLTGPSSDQTTTAHVSSEIAIEPDGR